MVSIAFGATALLALLLYAPVMADEKPSPYGTYKRGSAESDYGEKRPVSSIEEARKVLEAYGKGKDAKIGEIVERELFFEAEVLNGKGKVIDKVIVDKRTGRIRSIY